MRKGIKKILNWIIDIEAFFLEERIPSHWIEVDNTFVVEKLIEMFPYAKLYIADQKYYLCPREDIEEFLAADPTDRERYIKETFDCDDFSFRLMGQFHRKPYSALAIGITWSRVHAYNLVFLSADGQVFLIEPQTDEIMVPPEEGRTYSTRVIIM